MSIGPILRAPVQARAWRELAYPICTLVLAAVGVGYALAALLLSAVLTIVVIGIPLLALALLGARRFGAAHRALASALLGTVIPAPPRPRAGPGAAARIRARLGDGAAWRAMLFPVVALPLSVLQIYVVIFTWAWGFVALTYPIQRALGWNSTARTDAHGSAHRGWAIGSFHLDTPARQALVCVSGAALLLLAPWAMRAATLPSRLLAGFLLGAHGSERIVALQQTRARAVDDAAATLRRIERDLHDGAQGRLIALAMQLTLIREAVTDDTLGQLVATAQNTNRLAITELRELVRGIHPPVLDQGLDAALASLAGSAAVPVEVRVSLPTRPSAAIETIAYFCASELVTNAIKHANADRIVIDGNERDGWLRVSVTDNGGGGARASLWLGSGLAGIAERVRTVDGELTIDSPVGGPTVVAVHLPLHA